MNQTSIYCNRLWLAALPLLLAACQSDDMPAPAPDTLPANTLRAVMPSFGERSRAQVELGNPDAAQETFMWNSSDSFTLIDLSADNSVSTYDITGYTDDNPSAEAEFVGKGELVAGHRLAAIYPALADGVAAGTSIDLSVPTTISMTAAGSDELRDYMTRNMLMAATATAGDDDTALSFRHLCSMVRISYTNAMPDPVTVTGVTVASPAAVGTKAAYSPADGRVSTTGTSDDISIDFSGLTIASGETRDFYLLFLPGNELAADASVKITVNDASVDIPAAEIIANGSTRFEAGKRYWFNLMQTPASGLVRKSAVSTGTITNLSLIKILETDYGCVFTKDENGFVNVEANQETIDRISSINIYGSYDIDDYNGIEYLVNLTGVYINLPVKHLDLSHNEKLEEVHCYNVGLQTLKLPKNIKEVLCRDNNLTSLDIRDCTELTFLNCNGNQIQSLDLSRCPNLKMLYCDENKIKSLDLSGCPNLEVLCCNNNYNISELNTSNCPNLIELVCGNNKIEALDLSNNTKLAVLNLRGWGWRSEMPCNLIETLDLSANLELRELYFDNIPTLKTVDLSALTNLEKLSYGTYNADTDWIDISNNLKLKELSFGVDIDAPDLSKHTELERIETNGHDVKVLDLSHNTKLKHIQIANTMIQTLDISNNPNLISVWCYGNHLTSLDITNNPDITDLRCGEQQDDNWESIDLTLTLTAAQMPMWETMEHEWGNSRVTTVVKE